MATISKTINLVVANDDQFHPLMDFLERNESQSLPLPTAPDLKGAIASGSIYVAVEDGGAIAACAGCFDLCTGSDREDMAPANTTDVLELAGTRVTAAVGGLKPLSMQDCLISLRIVGALIARDERLDPRACIMAATLATAGQSRTTLARNGFHEIADPPRWLRLEQRSWTGAGSVLYFALSGGMVGLHAQRVLGFTTVPLTLTRNEGDESFTIRWDVPWFGWGLEAIRTLAGGFDGMGDVPAFRRLPGNDVI